MNSEYLEYKEILEELYSLLRKYNEENWANYFRKSLELLYKDKPQRSIAHTLSAYGGMGSFNDSLYFSGAADAESERGFYLADHLWTTCKNKRSLLKRILEW
ncbi:DUF6966 domain-containing protein [Shewanella insulae]|uniref:DUF6966 domain-containing protein n=1 Tax=Shewanella insulae TaxID=2681496 RepID=UPI0024818620|nr:hypothetical protein [Shewanella insulae]